MSVAESAASADAAPDMPSETTAETGAASGPRVELRYAHWLRRAAGYLIDVALYLLPFLPLWWASDALDWPPLYWVGALSGVTVLVWNMVVRQGRTGRTVGKQLLGIRLVFEETLEPIGPLNSFVRLAMHQVVDQLSLGLGYLWPWWDSKRQTFADKVMRTIVIVQKPE